MIQQQKYLPVFSEYCTSEYRYGFNGKEKDDEVKGVGNSLDFGARIYDSRIGRWLALDPLQAKYPDLSPYNFCANNPIIFIDPDGRKIDRFHSVGLHDFKKALCSTKEGKRIWKEMKRSETLIRVTVTEEVLVNQVSGGQGLVGGQFNPDADPVEKKGKLANGMVTKRGIFETGEIILSIGSYKAMQAVIKENGVKNWDDLTAQQKQEGLQKELSKSGKYKIRDENGQNISAEDINIVVGISNSNSNHPPISVDYETQNEYMQRISGHEGKHSYIANFLKSLLRKEGIPAYNEAQEKSAEESEQKIINEQKK